MPEGYQAKEYFARKEAESAGKLRAERILEVCLELKAEMTELKRMLGEPNMQSLNQRLTRIETKLTSMMPLDERGIDDGGLG